jgi:hypothetical protein
MVWFSRSNTYKITYGQQLVSLYVCSLLLALNALLIRTVQSSKCIVWCAFDCTSKKLRNIHTRFIPEGIAETSQIFLRDTHILPKWFNYEKYCRRETVRSINYEEYCRPEDVPGSRVVSRGFYIHTFLHTYIPLKLYPCRGSRDISDIPLRRPRFTKNTADVTGGKPITLIAVYLSLSRMNIWDASATPSGNKRDWYVWMYILNFLENRVVAHYFFRYLSTQIASLLQ